MLYIRPYVLRTGVNVYKGYNFRTTDDCRLSRNHIRAIFWSPFQQLIPPFLLLYKISADQRQFANAAVIHPGPFRDTTPLPTRTTIFGLNVVAVKQQKNILLHTHFFIFLFSGKLNISGKLYTKSLENNKTNHKSTKATKTNTKLQQINATLIHPGPFRDTTLRPTRTAIFGINVVAVITHPQFIS